LLCNVRRSLLCLPISKYNRFANFDADAEHQATVAMAIFATYDCILSPCVIHATARMSDAVRQ